MYKVHNVQCVHDKPGQSLWYSRAQDKIQSKLTNVQPKPPISCHLFPKMSEHLTFKPCQGIIYSHKQLFQSHYGTSQYQKVATPVITKCIANCTANPSSYRQVYHVLPVHCTVLHVPSHQRSCWCLPQKPAPHP